MQTCCAMPDKATFLHPLNVTREERLERLIVVTRGRYASDDPGHDWTHVERVVRSCQELGGVAGADLSLLVPAALLHDVVNRPKDDPARLLASRDAADEAARLLSQAGYSHGEILRICSIVLEHSYTAGRAPSSLESAILQDADRLDALGAVGILRAATCGARLGAAYYHSGDPFARDRQLDDFRYTLDHFYTKLLTLPETLNTEAARREAERRVVFMGEFLAELGREIGASANARPAVNPRLVECDEK